MVSKLAVRIRYPHTEFIQYVLYLTISVYQLRAMTDDPITNFTCSCVRVTSYPSSLLMQGKKIEPGITTFAQALDITAFIPSVAVRSMTNDVFTEDDLMGRCDLVWARYSRRQNKVPITDSKSRFKVVTKPLSKFLERATSRIKVAYNSA